jgi:cytoplasmic tRNA 2-thiolation protein 2
MDGYRAGPGEAKKVLLALSFGPSSLALLHVLDNQLQRQVKKSGRTGYKLHVLYVSEDADESASIDKLEALYPMHSYSLVPLRANSMLDLAEDEPISQQSASALSSSARSDLLMKARERLIIRTAQEKSCIGVVFGDSMTRLSERTLAETSNGRGFALAQMLSEGAALHGMPCRYPLRDLYRTELEQYIRHLVPALWALTPKMGTTDEYDGVIRQNASGKDISIDQLMLQYVADVEKQYPNIIANVARTGARLVDKASQHSAVCSICGFSLTAEDLEQQRKPGDYYAVAGDTPSTVHCHGCTRSLEDHT